MLANRSSLIQLITTKIVAKNEKSQEQLQNLHGGGW